MALFINGKEVLQVDNIEGGDGTFDSLEVDGVIDVENINVTGGSTLSFDQVIEDTLTVQDANDNVGFTLDASIDPAELVAPTGSQIVFGGTGDGEYRMAANDNPDGDLDELSIQGPLDNDFVRLRGITNAGGSTAENKELVFNGDLVSSNFDGTSNVIYDLENQQILQERLENSSIEIQTGDGLLNGGSVALGGSRTLNVAGSNTINVSDTSVDVSVGFGLEDTGSSLAVDEASNFNFSGLVSFTSLTTFELGLLLQDDRNIFFGTNQDFELAYNSSDDVLDVRDDNNTQLVSIDKDANLEVSNDINFPNITGTPTFRGHDHSEGGMTTIPNSGLTNDTVTVAGNSVSLGGSTSINHGDLSNIDSDDHHIRPSPGTALSEDGSNNFNFAQTLSGGGTQIITGPTDIDFTGTNDATVTVTDDGDGTATVDVDVTTSNDTRTDVSDSGGTVVSDTEDITYTQSNDATLTVTDDGDGTATVDISTTVPVDSVAGKTGAVTLDTDDVSEGSNLYYTDERAQDAVGDNITVSGELTFTYDDNNNQLEFGENISDSRTDISENGSTVVSDTSDINVTTSNDASASVTDDTDGTATLDISTTVPVDSVNGNTGAVSLGLSDLSGLDLSGNDLTDGATVIFDTSAGEIPDSAMGSIDNSTLTNDSITLNGGDGLKNGSTASLGGSFSLDVEPNDFAGTFLSDDGSDNLQVDTGTGLENDGSDNIRVNPSDLAGDGLLEDTTTTLGVNISDFAGSGIQDDGSENLELVNNSITINANDGIGGGGSVALGNSVDINADPGDFAGAGLSTSGSPADLNVGSGTGITVNAASIEIDTSASLTFSSAQTFNGGVTMGSDITPDSAGGRNVGTSSTFFNEMHATNFVTHSPEISKEQVNTSKQRIQEYVDQGGGSMNIGEMVAEMANVIKHQEQKIDKLQEELDEVKPN